MADEFTPAERQVLSALAEGTPDDEVATKLTIPDTTLRRHYEHLAEKLLSRSRPDE